MLIQDDEGEVKLSVKASHMPAIWYAKWEMHDDQSDALGLRQEQERGWGFGGRGGWPSHVELK
jgi:hypothetical protein